MPTVNKKGELKNNRGRNMPVERAAKLMSDYAKNNFNMYKTLIENGYSEHVANKQAGRTMNRAKEIVQDRLAISNDKTINEVAETTRTLYEVVGIQRETVLERYKGLIMQETHPNVALRALEPLLAQENVTWTEKQGSNAPQVAITIEEVHTKTGENDPISVTPSE